MENVGPAFIFHSELIRSEKKKNNKNSHFKYKIGFNNNESIGVKSSSDQQNIIKKWNTKKAENLPYKKGYAWYIKGDT